LTVCSREGSSLLISLWTSSGIYQQGSPGPSGVNGVSLELQPVFLQDSHLSVSRVLADQYGDNRDQKYNGVWKIPTLSDYLDVIQVRA
jgi:hypothetical protein